MDQEKSETGKRILFVDDEVDIRTAVTYRLKKSGYEVIVSGDGKEALEKARTESPDLIILDVMLPKMDGNKVCALLKRDKKYMDIPIIMFTASVESESIMTDEEGRADAFITKPFEAPVLIAKIEELLEKAKK